MEVFCMFKSLLTFRTEGEDLEGGLKEDSNNTNCQKEKVYLSVWKNLKDVVMRSKIITTINCIGILKRPQDVTSSKTENAWRKCVLISYSVLKKCQVYLSPQLTIGKSCQNLILSWQGIYSETSRGRNRQLH